MAHLALVLGVHERVRTWVEGDPLGHQRPQVLGGDVLVVEGQHVAAGGEGPQGVEVAVVADHDLGRGQRRGVVGGLGQHPQPDAQGDAGLVRHPGQLASSDDSHHREIGGDAHRP